MFLSAPAAAADRDRVYPIRNPAATASKHCRAASLNRILVGTADPEGRFQRRFDCIGASLSLNVQWSTITLQGGLSTGNWRASWAVYPVTDSLGILGVRLLAKNLGAPLHQICPESRNPAWREALCGGATACRSAIGLLVGPVYILYIIRTYAQHPTQPLLSETPCNARHVEAHCIGW